MADSLILKGIKDVRKHKGDEMLFRYPKGRGDAQHQLKRWWVNGGVTKLYTPASVFDVTTPGGTVKLAVATSPSSTIRIDHDGNGNFSFFGVLNVDNVALFTESFELIEHYVMPRQSGGKVMTVTPADGATRPETPAPTPAPTPTPTPSPTDPPDGGRSRRTKAS